MSDRRTARLNEQFKREISHILAHKVRDPRVGRVLVTSVRVTADLWLARVFVRTLDGIDDCDETMGGLDAASAFIRRELGKVLSVRRIPELRFLHDTTFDSARRIEEVLKEVLPENGPHGPEADPWDVGSGENEGSEEPEGSCG